LRLKGWQLCERLFALRDFLSSRGSPARKWTTQLSLEVCESRNAPQDLFSLLPAAGIGVPLLTPTAALFDGFTSGKTTPLPAPAQTSFNWLPPQAKMVDPAPTLWLPTYTPAANVGGGQPQLAPNIAIAAPDVPADPFPDVLGPVFPRASPIPPTAVPLPEILACLAA
jgi:hypothetical protein